MKDEILKRADEVISETVQFTKFETVEERVAFLQAAWQTQNDEYFRVTSLIALLERNREKLHTNIGDYAEIIFNLKSLMGRQQHDSENI